jgi:hypothetical protein
MNLDTDAQRHLRALLKHIGENPVDVKSVTFNLDKATVTITKRKTGGSSTENPGVGVEDTSQKTGEWVYTEGRGGEVTTVAEDG